MFGILTVAKENVEVEALLQQYATGSPGPARQDSTCYKEATWCRQRLSGGDLAGVSFSNSFKFVISKLALRHEPM